MISVLFESHHLYYLSNFTPIIKELRRRGGFKIYLSIPKTVNSYEQQTFEQAAKGLDVEFLTAADEETRIEKLRRKNFDVIFVGNVGRLNSIVSDKTISVMVYHGIGLKQTYYRDISERIDVRAVESEGRYRELSAQGFRNLVLTGFTKLDPLATPIINREKTLEEMDLHPDLKTVLYAPSFYPTSQKKLLPELVKLGKDFNIVIKLHNFSWYQGRYHYQSKGARELASTNKNIYLIPSEYFDIIPFYSLADVLISDISSTLFEFLSLNRPIIMTEFFTLRLKHKVLHKRFLRKLDLYRMKSINFVYRMSNPDAASSLISHALKYPDEMFNERTKAVEQYLYKADGKASARLVDAIENKMKQRK